jgi:glycosyltransferase involved in cell wall biosynthesis
MNSISVVIPLFNKRETIKRTINSVLFQTHNPLEIIVVNDGSNDDSPSVVQTFESPLIKIIHQKNSGVSAARNKGIREAKGELIAFLDADDIWKPEYLKTILKLRQKFPNAGAYATSYERVSNAGNFVLKVKNKKLPAPPWEGIIKNYFDINSSMPILCTDTMVVPKIIFERIGGFLENIHRGEDREMWVRIALDYNIAYSHYVGASYFRSFNSNTKVDTKYQYHSDASINTLNRAIDEGDLNNNLLPSIINYIDFLRINDARRAYVAHNDFKKAIELLWEVKPKTYKIFLLKFVWLSCFLMPVRVFVFVHKIKNNLRSLVSKKFFVKTTTISHYDKK